MTENMKAFMYAIENNEELKKKFDEISDKEQAEQKDYTDEYIALAKSCGITLTKEDFELDQEELSDEDLENVSGGHLPKKKIIRKDFRDIPYYKRTAGSGTTGGSGTTVESGTTEESGATEDQNY